MCDEDLMKDLATVLVARLPEASAYEFVRDALSDLGESQEPGVSLGALGDAMDEALEEELRKRKAQQ